MSFRPPLPRPKTAAGAKPLGAPKAGPAPMGPRTPPKATLTAAPGHHRPAPAKPGSCK